MNFVIGDIHGELTKLQALVKNILSTDKDATMIFIGDYLDKGEDPHGTLTYLTRLSSEIKCIFLRGNHEFYWELLQDGNDKYAQYLLKYGGKNTMLSFNENADISEIKERIFNEFGSFFNSLKNYYITDNYVITHSGIPPELFSESIEKISPDQLLFNRYDFIRNHQLYDNKKVIFGHTAFYSPFYDGVKIGIDTSACYTESQPLTAFCTSGDFFINSTDQTIFKLSDINQSCCPVITRVTPWRQK